MATRYKKYADGSDYKINAIQRILDNGTISCIPVDEENTDYKEYLEWVAEGNTAEAAD
tara:strand:- start:634 stop:807 length:174 start_codon:yes stop_codon:yes gene_type:complete